MVEDLENKPKIVAIVPALNEEPTVAGVVSILKKSPYLDEVIVVSAGSTDETARVAREAGATVFEPPANGSKGASLLYGVEKTDAQIVLFVDADLYGFKVEHVERLVRPVIEGKRAMNIGLRDRGWWQTELTKHLPLISGERALKREIIKNIEPKFLQGFMVETALNYYCRSHRRNYGAVKLPGLNMRKKIDKVGWIRGSWQYLVMSFQVIKAMVVVRLAKKFGQ